MDLTGYPHESEAAAMMSDWAALGVDIRAAVKRIESYIGDEGERDGGGEGRPEKNPPRARRLTSGFSTKFSSLGKDRFHPLQRFGRSMSLSLMVQSDS